MADDISQDQTQTQDTQQPVVPPTKQPPVETPPSQLTPEQPQSTPTEIPTTETPQPAETKTESPIITEPQPEQVPVTSTETPPPVSPPGLNIPALHYPFSGNFPVTFSFGQQSDNEEIKKKFREWGIVGHNGLDFGLTSGTEVFPCDVGKVVQSGDNGDFGISITIQHSWGTSVYAHLQETKVSDGEEIGVNKVIGLSGSTGAAFGEHLHFAIKPNNPDLNNGYLGFIDPAPYLSLSSQKEKVKPEVVETPPPAQPIPEETKPSEPVPQPETTPQQQPTEPEPTINIEPEKSAEQSQQPETPQIPSPPKPMTKKFKNKWTIN